MILIIFSLLQFSFAAEIHQYTGFLEPKLLISMNLEKDGTSIKGSYSYNSKGQPITLKGTWEKNQILITESDSAGKPMGQFSGEAPTGNFPKSLSGKWQPENKNKKARPFRLYKLEQSEKIILTPKIGFGENQEAYLWYELNGLDSKPIQDKINKKIEAAVCAPSSSTETDEDGEMTTTSKNCSIQIEYFSSTLLSFTTVESEFSGGPYPNNSESTEVISLVTGEPIAWKEFTQFSPDTTKKWELLLKEMAKKEELPDLTDKILKSQISYTVNREGVVIHNLYSNRAHAIAGVIFKITWAQLKPLLGDKALAKKFIQ